MNTYFIVSTQCVQTRFQTQAQCHNTAQVRAGSSHIESSSNRTLLRGDTQGWLTAARQEYEVRRVGLSSHIKSSSDRMPLKGNIQSLFWLSATAQPTVQGHVRAATSTMTSSVFQGDTPHKWVPNMATDTGTMRSNCKGNKGNKGMGGQITSASEPKVTECALFVMI